DAYSYLKNVNTFGGSLVACAVALKNIEILEQEALFECSKEIGAATLQTLQQQLQHQPNVGDVRGKGLLIGIELVADKVSKEHLPVEKVNMDCAKCKE
ncbi:aminotransferase class III-fold pyridoxal phosphate-dependent enzyme, partial [Bacillus paralicheniformis]|uniref:aminotransferase class III-fold pyridoxal phosphate-dependent enzyme n=1 Tax=Bacillus paralicheniformis TaxID=1648923 RepID=UPI0020C15F16